MGRGQVLHLADVDQREQVWVELLRVELGLAVRVLRDGREEPEVGIAARRAVNDAEGEGGYAFGIRRDRRPARVARRKQRDGNDG